MIFVVGIGLVKASMFSRLSVSPGWPLSVGYRCKMGVVTGVPE